MTLFRSLSATKAAPFCHHLGRPGRLFIPRQSERYSGLSLSLILRLRRGGAASQKGELGQQHSSSRSVSGSAPLLLDRSFTSGTTTSSLNKDDDGPQKPTTNQHQPPVTPITASCSSAHRPMTVRERVALFPTSVKMLWKDWLLYQNIRDAASTRRNAWTVEPKRLSPQGARAVDIVHSRIPWRQREQQRRFIDGIGTVLPVVLLWMIPFVGYVPMFVAIAAPRQLLSRHFHNEYEQFEYNRLAYQQRYAKFAAVQELFLAHVSDEARLCVEQWRKKEVDSHKTSDAAGPLLDNLLPFYEIVFASGSLSTVDRLPRNYLVQFALSVGVHQTFPPDMSVHLAQLSPSWWLRRKVRHIATTVEDDDNALLLQREESFGEPTTHGEGSVAGTLSEMEVMDACLMRGLPVVDTTVEQMRGCLANHLNMIAALEKQMSAAQSKTSEDHAEEKSHHISVNDESLGLFTLHLAILRDCLKNDNK